MYHVNFQQIPLHGHVIQAHDMYDCVQYKYPELVWKDISTAQRQFTDLYPSEKTFGELNKLHVLMPVYTCSCFRKSLSHCSPLI